jgi:hypothetical protein
MQWWEFEAQLASIPAKENHPKPCGCGKVEKVQFFPSRERDREETQSDRDPEERGRRNRDKNT